MSPREPTNDAPAAGPVSAAGFWRRLARRPGLLESLAALAWLGSGIDCCTDVSNSFAVLMAAAAWLGLTSVWTIHLLVALASRPHDRLGPTGWASWLLLPAATAILLALGGGDRGQALRIALFERELTEFVEASADDPGVPRIPGRVGSFPVKKVERNRDHVLLFMGALWFQEEGLAYLPAGRPPGTPASPTDLFVPIYGPWFRFHRGDPLKLP